MGRVYGQYREIYALLHGEIYDRIYGLGGFSIKEMYSPSTNLKKSINIVMPTPYPNTQSPLKSLPACHTLKRIFILKDAESAWLDAPRSMLTAGPRAVGVAIDTSVDGSAAIFVGNGVSIPPSNLCSCYVTSHTFFQVLDSISKCRVSGVPKLNLACHIQSRPKHLTYITLYLLRYGFGRRPLQVCFSQ